MDRRLPGLRTRYCPDCGTETDQTKMPPDVEVDRCAECNGIWLDHGELKEMLKGRISERANPRDMASARRCERTCPDCDRDLFRRQFLGVQIDQCIHCAGIFLSSGNLRRIKAAIRAGKHKTAQML